MTVFIMWDIVYDTTRVWDMVYDIILHIVYDIECTYDIEYYIVYDIVYYFILHIVYDIVCTYDIIAI